MKKNTFFKNKKLSVLVIISLVAVAVIVVWGSYIPLVNKLPIPFIAGDHSGHLLKPVFDEKGEIEYWTCGMHPSVRMMDPGGCPICGMDLVPIRNEPAPQEADMESAESAPGGGGMQGHQHGGAPMSRPAAGRKPKSTFTVSPERQQMINVKKESVEMRVIDNILRTVGNVELDETTISHINMKIEGWIEKVYIDFTWQKVNRGQPLFSIYSPELVSTQEELLLALKYRDSLSQSEFPEVSGGSASLVESTRRRLRLFDISHSQIRRIEETGMVQRSLVINSPVTGYVTYKNAFENMFVTPNTRVYTIADLRTVWVYADIYENEISLVKVGQRAALTVGSLPGETFEGLITYIQPNVDPKTRTVKVRVEFPNPAIALFPGMYANVEIFIPQGEFLAVAESAVLRTGKENLVFVDKGQGALELRKVEIGRKAGGFYEVLRGLKQGDVVISNSRFLIDAESKLKGVVASWGGSPENTALGEAMSPSEDMHEDSPPVSHDDPGAGMPHDKTHEMEDSKPTGEAPQMPHDMTHEMEDSKPTGEASHMPHDMTHEMEDSKPTGEVSHMPHDMTHEMEDSKPIEEASQMPRGMHMHHKGNSGEGR